MKEPPWNSQQPFPVSLKKSTKKNLPIAKTVSISKTVVMQLLRPIRSLSFLLFVLSLLFSLVSEGSAQIPDIRGGNLMFMIAEGESNPPVIGFQEDGGSVVIPEMTVKLGIFGDHLEHLTRIVYFKLADEEPKSAKNCSGEIGVEAAMRKYQAENTHWAESTEFSFPSDKGRYYLCTETIENPETLTPVIGANMEVHTQYKVRHYYLPMPLQIAVISVLLVLSGLFSGLNLGLMSLDPTELELVKKSGSPSERKDAETILPVRRSGNYLLCSLLLGNVVVNAGISILFDDLTSGYVALVVSTFGIVIFGEIVPQSICNKKGLAVGARTIWLTRFFMIVTFPLSYPIGKILDCVLGAEAGRVYNKERLMELIKMSVQSHADQALAEEFKIVSGALEIHNKTVKDVMTKIEDVFMLPSDATLNVGLVADVVQNGYTRIPVYDSKDRNNVISLLNVKDLALLDPDDNLSVKTVCDYWHHPLRFIMEDTPLKVMLEEFKKGHYHLALVQKIEVFDDKDPVYALSGLVTLEDIIEEILQAEIVDETDIITDNVQRKRRKDGQLKDLTKILERESSTEGQVGVQLQLAAAQWLCTNMPPLSDSYISTNILQRMISRNAKSERPSETFDRSGSDIRTDAKYKQLYTSGMPSDKFVLILEGRMEVNIGKSGMTFEAGPFQVFGTEVIEKMAELAPKMTIHTGSISHLGGNAAALQGESMRNKVEFIPDFTVYVKSDVTYLMISASTYLNAFRLSLIENQKGISSSGVSSPSGIEVAMGRITENGPSILSEDDLLDNHLNHSEQGSPSKTVGVGLNRNQGSGRATIGSPKEIKDRWFNRGMPGLDVQKVAGKRQNSAEQIVEAQKKRANSGIEKVGLIDLDEETRKMDAKKRARAGSANVAGSNVIVRMKDKLGMEKESKEDRV